MRGMKRILAMLLAVVMVVGLIPATVFAADADVDYLFLATDRHANTSIIGTMINNMEAKIGENELDYLALGGDMVGSGGTHPAYNSSTVLGEVTGATSSLSAANVDIVAGIHDMNVNDDAGIVLPYSGGGAQIYEGNKFYVYGVPESCISGAVSGVDPATEANDFVTWANGSTIDKSKAIIVVSHYPLHQRRNDNDGAVYWASALNTVAAGDDTTIDRNVAFFWGHNHTGETSADTAVYHVEPNGSISVQGGSSNQKIYFTYANAGYLKDKSSATLVTITDTSITFDKYVSSSVSTSYSVNRVQTTPAATLESIEVSGTTEYTVGGNGLELTVTATYSDDTTKDVTGDATFSPAELTASGKHTVTASYGGKTDTIDVTVNLYDEVLAANGESLLMGVEAFSQGATALEVTWDDAADAVLEAEGLYTDYVVYDLALTNPGETTTYSMTLVDNMDTTNLAVYHVAKDGTLTAVPYTIKNDCVVFTTSLTGAFAYGNITVPEGYTLQSITLANIPTDLFVGGSLDLMNAVITATYTKEGAEDFVRQLTVYDYDENNFSGYDVDTVGAQTAVFTFEGVTATLDIHVWGHEFTSGDVTVSVDNEGSEYGVANVNVATSTNANVADAIQYVITGDYVAYDITLTYENGYSETEDAKTVTLPIPEGVTNPVVYYVSDSGKSVVDMKAVNNGNGTVTFTTNHFSTYVVGEGTTIETGSQNATTESTTTTTTKTVYVLSNSISSGNKYLIVNGNSAGDGYYALANNNGTVAATGVTIKTDSSIGTYIELDDATDELWTVAGSYTFECEDGYLYRASTNNTNTYVPRINDNSTTWSYSTSNRRLSYTRNNSTYYLYYNSGWKVTTSSNSAASIYFYIPTQVEIEVGEPGHTYSVEGTDVEAAAVKDATVELSAALYDTPDGGTKTDITAASGLTPTYEVVTTKGNPNVITSISGNTATLSGVVGTAVVKVTYTSGDLVAWDEFTVTATAPDHYSIQLHKKNGDTYGDEITAPVALKGVKAGDTYSVWAVVKAHASADDTTGTDLGTLGNALSWTVSDTSIATIDTTTGVITFTGNNYGTFDVTVAYEGADGKVITDTITISATESMHVVPGDGTDDFPEYPNEGAIRFDKHATAVGNFSETGIAQVELSMTGVPYSTGSEIDVVVMLDMTGSMSANGMEAAEEATKAFVKLIVTNEDGTYNKNRVAVYAFNSGSSSPYELVSLKSITSDSELETANTAIDTASNKQTSGGTPFDEAAQKCYDVLQAAKKDGTGNDRQQFCVFMSDGGPTSYAADDGDGTYTTITNSGSGTTAITTYFSGYNSSTSSSWSFTLPTEYYTNLMKADGVTVYTVGLLLQNKPSNPSPYSSMTASTYDSTTDSLTTVGSHYYFTSRVLKQMASEESKYIDIFNVDNASKATAAFESIAKEIREAATDVTVTDKITSDYTMVFEAPNTSVADALPAGQEMYIEVKDYVLNPVYTAATGITEFAAGITYYTKGTNGTYTEVTGSFVNGTTYYTITDYTRGTSTSLVKLYLGKSGTTYYAASNANGTAYAAPTFNQTAIGTMYYWTTTADTSSGVSVTVDGTTYYFVAAGISNKDEDFVAANWYNMASGAYASGNIEKVDILDANGKEISENSTCNDLIIATPHFVYNASTKMLVWTAAKLSTSELTLTYFLYLDESGGYSGAQGETDPGTYETNEYAHLNYTNFQGTECQQTMPVPQMTWNGAQVSYVFYLVNEAGQPVNRAGRVVPFSEAVYVTDVHTYSIVWNDLEQVASLEAAYLAEELVPEIYDLYDNGATYNIHVFEDEEGQNLNNHFVIGSGLNTYTTYVFNNKSDATKYKVPGAYAAATTYKCKEYVEGGQYTDDEGAYNIVSKSDATAVETGFDFSNTTVAFAVVWRPELQEDVVVIDFGLDVVVDVITNDAMAAGVVGVRADQPDVAINSGTYDAAKSTTADIYIDANNDGEGLKELKIGTATVASMTSVRFSLDETNGMQFNKPAVFYYEADVNFYDDAGELQTTSMYSSVTVIPATTVYYEDSFVTFSDNWSVEGTTSNKTQDVDRPGTKTISEAYDANNVYGYDSAYETMSTYSMGSAHKVHVDANSYGTATFSFYGTGFDVISMTSNTTGTITVKVTDAKGEKVEAKAVNTYYGYTKNEDGSWTATPDKNVALYQVPVMQVNGLAYGQYTVTITATWAAALDKTTADGYDLYLDAIRIYDPTGVASNSVTNDVVSNAYKDDGEGWPTYMELRDQLLTAKDFEASLDSTVLTGAMFIDGISALGEAQIADYTSYGPNNEVYLAPGQGVAFTLTNADRVHVGMRRMTGTATYTIESYDEDGKLIKSVTGDVTSATDMYYDITDLKDGTIVIRNSGTSGELMLTNLKYTFESNPASAQVAMFMTMRRSAMVLSALNTVEESTETETEDTVTDGNTNTGNTTGDNTNTEVEDTVPGETEPEVDVTEPEVDVTEPEVDPTEPEVDPTVPGTDKPAEDIPEEETPEVTPPAEEPSVQQNFWTGLWNAIKSAFSRLFGWA